jgi:hypothetical protein
MAISKILKEEIDHLISGNTIYIDNVDRYEYLFESYIGGDTYREGNHLVRYQLESPQEYANRLASTHLDNHCQSVVQVYNSFLFRETPDRELGSIELLPEVESFLKDADLDGRDLDSFMKEVSTWASVWGHAWIMMAKPNTNSNTRAEELDQEVRPYVNIITPLMMLDWSYQRNTNGRYTLDYVKYIEDINGSLRTIKEWRPDMIKTTTVDIDEGLLTDSIEETNQLGIIPAVCVYNKRSTVRGLGVSDINDIANAQKTIYNLNSEIDSSIRLDSHPSLVKTPNTEAGAGAGAIIHMPEDMDPALKPYILENSGANIDSILATIDKIVESIDKMANTGAVRATESRVLSGVSRDTEFALLSARLSEKADNLELAEEQLWRLFARYQGQSYDGTVKYPDSFGIRDKNNEVMTLLEARKVVTDPTIVQNLEYSIAHELLEEHELESEMEHPTLTQENRQPHIEAMIMEGYTDQQILELHPEITSEQLQQAKLTLVNSND